MSVSLSIGILILVLFIAANLPWFSERFLVFIKPQGNQKKTWMRLLEWFLLYFIAGFTAIGLEKKLTGQVHDQDWEFYVVGFFLFMVFAFPGFVYRYELKKKKYWKKQLKNSLPVNDVDQNST